MKKFTLDNHMISAIGGAFYPTGHSMVMFPSEADASRIGHQLIERDVVSGDEVYLIPASEILAQITPTVKDTDNPLPSAGTDGATVRAYTKLAREGHAGLLVKTRDETVAEKVMEVVRQAPYSIAQRYRRLVIEDL
ncbi:hypothetical protein QTI66_08005 [Variovorax sp. J22R133]|uniref:hypothetical protein n=1 Tax=Variovorax brevis TaxID=3053503 RepID=UPI0025784B51|nr:hypothetical protein [Variovorax sp. J22R133]MDM0112089.1 hypothetical protein [Variovorax sp. J22R133]